METEKCQTLVRSRWLPTHKDESGKVVMGKRVSLKCPEPCGENGKEYRVRQRARKQNKPKDQYAFLTPGSIPAGSMTVRQAFCDKHKRKAERENFEFLPEEKYVESAEKSCRS